MNNGQALITIRDMTKTYRMGDLTVEALRGVSLDVHAGEMMAIMGPSGSGKSTLMNILGALDVPTSGTYPLDGQDVSRMQAGALSTIRNRKIGFVFQSFNLLPRTSALANVELPLIYAGITQSRRPLRGRPGDGAGWATACITSPTSCPADSSSACAIARALVNSPSLILADEPTGNLDSKSGEEIMRIFQELNEQRGITILFVTHEPDIAEHTRRIVRLADGLIVSDAPVAVTRRAAMPVAAGGKQPAAQPAVKWTTFGESERLAAAAAR